MKIRMLDPWLKGNESITPKNFYDNNNLDLSMGAFVSLVECTSLHEVIDFENVSIKENQLRTRIYIEEALDIVNVSLDQYDISLDNEEKFMILDALGDPPTSSYNLYIITAYTDNEEFPVYIGKTDSKTNRFSNGHLTALKLHNPIYQKYQKRVYWGTIMFVTKDKAYLPLEYITPYEQAKEMLSNIESMMIHYFKPDLNSQYKENMNLLIERPVILHIQNMTGVTEFLNDTFL